MLSGSRAQTRDRERGPTAPGALPFARVPPQRRRLRPYSHSIVPGGFDVTSYTTRLTLKKEALGSQSAKRLIFRIFRFGFRHLAINLVVQLFEGRREIDRDPRGDGTAG
jgi:hypothetical protein